MSKRKNKKFGIKCGRCGEELYSYHTHDFKYCGCGGVFVDGGDDYLRYGRKGWVDAISIWKEVEGDDD